MPAQAAVHSEPEPSPAGQAGRQHMLVDLGDPPALLPRAGERLPLGIKAAALLALALLEPGIARKRAALLLWPDSPETLARNNLRTLVHRLQRQVGAELFGGGDGLELPDGVLRLRRPDADELLATLTGAGAGRAAPLAGIDLPDLEEYQAWLGLARRQLVRCQLADLEQAHRAAVQAGDAVRAVALARACVALEPLSEHWHRVLMQTLAIGGDGAAALVAYEDCKALLRENLGAVPDERTRSLHVRILQSQERAPAAGVAPAAPQAALVEREAALASLQHALAEGRHVALSGEAGVGKTRLLRQHVDGRASMVLQVQTEARHEPYAALAQVLQQVQQQFALRLGSSERVELARVAPAAFPDAQPTGGSLSNARLRAALCHWAQRLHEAGVPLLALDDLHQADPHSQAALAGLLSTADPAPHPLVLLLSYRSGELEPMLADAVIAAQQQRRLDTVVLERLSERGIAALLQSLGQPADVAARRAADLLQATGGNPLFVVELTLFQQGHEGALPMAPIGTNLQALLQSRLASCSDTARQLACVAGVAGHEFSVDLAAALSGITPLALMPAWTELQQRGLFSDHGLAHDLVRSAVVAGLPLAIKAALHRQVAEHLERSGRSGAAVAHHWEAAGDAGRAFPHVELHLQALAHAGLELDHRGLRLLSLIEQLPDAALRGKLWWVTDISVGRMPLDVLDRLERLVRRVEAMPHDAETSAWIAVERAQLQVYRDRQVRTAYDTLLRKTAGLEMSPVARIYVGQLLTALALQTGQPAHLHARSAVDAGLQLPPGPRWDHLRRDLVVVRSAFLREGAVAARETARDLRRARAAHDAGAERLAHAQLALVFRTADFSRGAARHFAIVSRGLVDQEHADWFDEHGFLAGQMQLFEGGFADAVTAFERCMARGGPRALHARSLLAWTWAMLGRLDLAGAVADDIDPAELEANFTGYAVQARVRSVLAGLRGGDARAPLAQALERMQALGAAPVNQVQLRVMLAEMDGPPEAALQEARRGLRIFDPPFPSQPTLPLLVSWATAAARAGSPEAHEAVLRAASVARRGRTVTLHYLPATLCTLADLLQPTDPREARALRHVALRWLHKALPQVPACARESFQLGHPVNTPLLEHRDAG